MLRLALLDVPEQRAAPAVTAPSLTTILSNLAEAMVHEDDPEIFEALQEAAWCVEAAMRGVLAREMAMNAESVAMARRREERERRAGAAQRRWRPKRAHVEALDRTAATLAPFVPLRRPEPMPIGRLPFDPDRARAAAAEAV